MGVRSPDSENCLKAKSTLFIQETIVDGQIWRNVSTQPVGRLTFVKNGFFGPFSAKFGLFVSEKRLRCPASDMSLKAKSRGILIRNHLAKSNLTPLSNPAIY